MGNCLKKKDKESSEGGGDKVEDTQDTKDTQDTQGGAQEEEENVLALTNCSEANKEGTSAAGAHGVATGWALNANVQAKINGPNYYTTAGGNNPYRVMFSSGGGGQCVPQCVVSRFRVVDRCCPAPIVLGRFRTAKACSTPTSTVAFNKFGVAQGCNYERGCGPPSPCCYQRSCPSTSTNRFCSNSCMPQVTDNCMNTQQMRVMSGCCAPRNPCAPMQQQSRSNNYYGRRQYEPTTGSTSTGAGQTVGPVSTRSSIQTPYTSEMKSASYIGRSISQSSFTSGLSLNSAHSSLSD